jgi:hypothetical protein
MTKIIAFLVLGFVRNNILISVPATEEFYTEGTDLNAAGINRFADLVVEQL